MGAPTSHFSRDLGVLALLCGAGASAGAGAGLLAGARLARVHEVSPDGLLRAADLALWSAISPFFAGLGAIFFPVAGLLLALVLAAVGLIVALRPAERGGLALIRAAVGLAVGVGLAFGAYLLGGGPDRTVAAMTAARFGEAQILGAVLWPLVAFATLAGTTVGGMAGALLATSWLRRVLLAGLAPAAAVAALAVALAARPPLLEVPRGAPDLERGEGTNSVVIFVVGGSDEARPVTLTLDSFASSGSKGQPLRVTRRNVGRAQKALEVLPPLHPASAEAERVLVAGALAELNVEAAVEHLFEAFLRRADRGDGLLLATVLGRAAPTESIVRYLEAVADPSKVHVGPAAAKRLCPLAALAGREKVAAALRCAAPAGQPTLGTVKAVVSFKGRPMKRAPAGLVAEPEEIRAPWVESGLVSAASLALVAGTQTDASGSLTFGSVPPGAYLLAFAPVGGGRGKSGALKLGGTVRVVVPESGGLVDLGEISAGETPNVRRGGRARPPDPVRPEGDEAPDAEDVATAGDRDDQDGAPELDNGRDDARRPVRASQGPDRPLTPSARRLVSKVTPAGPNRVSVPAGFGRELLDAERTAFSPATTLAPASGDSGRGLELRGIRPDGVEVALGLRDGDIVETVNGRSLRTPDDVVALVDHLRGQRRVTVRVRRDGRPVILRIDVE